MSMRHHTLKPEGFRFLTVGYLALSVLSLASGCVFREPFPEEWEAVQESSGECPKIAGIYKNLGQLDPSLIEKGQYTAYWEIPLTGELFYDENGKEVVSATHVEISQPKPGAIYVTAWNESEMVAQANFFRDEGDFKCKSGFVVFHIATNCGGTPEAFGCGTRNDHFTTSSDGALIMMVNEKGVAAVMIFLPAAVSEWRWYRFELMTP